MVKIDVIALIHGIYTEFSNIYSISNNGLAVNQKQGNSETSILSDLKELYQEGNYFKTAKRMFSLYYMTHKHKSVRDKLLNLFNCDLGLLNQVCNNIFTLIYMFENYTKLDMDSIKNELDDFIDKIEKVHSSHSFLRDNKKYIKILQKLINETDHKIILKLLKKLYKNLNDKLQHITFLHLKSVGVFPLVID
jgi:uncharacterized protein (UPF0335 family)